MELVYDCVSGLTKLIGKLWLRTEVTLVGIDALPYQGPLIIAPNHASYLDPPLMAGVWWPTHRLDFFASSHLFRSFFLGKLLPRLRTHPLVRGNSLQAMRQALRFLEEKKTIVLFPEGTRSKAGGIGTLKKGIAMLSCKAHCPVVPVFISGTYEVWPPHQKYPNLIPRKRVRIRIGKPVPPCKEGDDDYSEWLQQLREAYTLLENS